EPVAIAGAPEGFQATPGGTVLKFGEKAQVVSTNFAGHSFFWEVTATGTHDLPADAVALEQGGENVDHFVCMDWEMTYLGSSEATPPPNAILPDSLNYPATHLQAIAADGQLANNIAGAPGVECVQEGGTPLPENASELQVGFTYRNGTLSFVAPEATEEATEEAAEGAVEAGRSPEGLQWNYSFNEPNGDTIGEPNDWQNLQQLKEGAVRWYPT
ncbi:MAG TPA: hypothetical protein H9867_06235, partial [Candidatus Corynebacterium gallistercoris]|nr:hypothetical protein [Candidatus Corynebacterium gallistercoris]